MTEVKPVVMGKYDFQYQDEMFILANFDFSDSHDSDARMNFRDVYRSAPLQEHGF